MNTKHPALTRWLSYHKGRSARNTTREECELMGIEPARKGRVLVTLRSGFEGYSVVGRGATLDDAIDNALGQAGA
jgi:hypothetical protein